MAVFTALDLCAAAAGELNLFDAGSPLPPDDATFLLGKLNRILDLCNAQGAAVYGLGFSSFTLTPALQPHTIGLAANAPTLIVTGNRPQKLASANLVIGGVHHDLTLRDDAWYAALSVRTITSPIPTDLYYSADWPNGSIYLYPVLSGAASLELWIATVLLQLALTDTFTLPPGYQEWLTLALAKSAARSYGKAVTPDLREAEIAARAIVFAANDQTPRGSTIDLGTGGGDGGGTYLTGWWR